jgi:hypothetical protein
MISFVDFNGCAVSLSSVDIRRSIILTEMSEAFSEIGRSIKLPAEAGSASQIRSLFDMLDTYLDPSQIGTPGFTFENLQSLGLVEFLGVCFSENGYNGLPDGFVDVFLGTTPFKTASQLCNCGQSESVRAPTRACRSPSMFKLTFFRS